GERSSFRSDDPAPDAPTGQHRDDDSERKQQGGEASAFAEIDDGLFFARFEGGDGVGMHFLFEQFLDPKTQRDDPVALFPRQARWITEDEFRKRLVFVPKRSETLAKIALPAAIGEAHVI